VAIGLPVVVLTDTNPVDVSFSQLVSPRQPKSIVVENPTPYNLLVTTGVTSLYIPAFVGDRLALATNVYSFKIIPLGASISAGTPFIAGTLNSIFCTVYIEGEPEPIGYPISLQIPTSLPTDQIQSQTFDVALGAGLSQNLVGAIAGKTIYAKFLNIIIATVAAAEIVLEDNAGGGTGVAIALERTDAVHSTSHNLLGIPMTVGKLARLRNTSGGAAGTVAGEFIYVQK
jgi:hypothetical protein